MRNILPVYVLLLLACSGKVASETPTAVPEWSGGEAGEVAAVLSGESLQLTDGRVLRLAAVRMPRAPLTFEGSETWRREAEAAEALLHLAPPGSRLHFVAATPSHDRHRRLLAQVRTAEGAWLQEELLRRGAVMLDIDVPPPLVVSLRQAEGSARTQGRGLWGDPAHAPVAAEAAGGAVGRFAVVEGRVVAVGEVRGTGYLNFDEDWRSDFTIRLSVAARRRFEQAGQPIADYEGARLRVRGWVFYSGGPMIQAHFPSQIEVLAE